MGIKNAQNVRKKSCNLFVFGIEKRVVGLCGVYYEKRNFDCNVVYGVDRVYLC